MLFLLHFFTAQADCDQTIREDRIVAHLDGAVAAYEARDRTRLDNEMEAVDALNRTGCLARPLSAPAVVLWFQASGLHLSVQDGGNPARARAAFAAARSVDPDSALPRAIAPGPERGIYNDYYAIPLNSMVPTTLPSPAGGTLLVNGTESTDLPQNWPSIIQYVDRSGEVRLTHYRSPSEETIPHYPNWPSRRGPIALGGASAALLGTGGFFLATFYSAYYKYCDPSRSGENSCGVDYYNTNLRWRLPLGAALAGTGAAAGIGAGIWAATSDGDISVSVRGRW